MAALTTQQIVAAGLSPTFASCAGGGDTAVADDRTFLEVKNAHTSTQDVTLVCPTACNLGGAGSLHNLTVTVPANTGHVRIPLGPAGKWNDPATGRASITYSGVTALTIAVVRN